MTNFRKVSALAFGVGLVSFSTHASFTANDIYLGFSKSGASSDYIIDLGTASSVVGGSTPINLSSHFNLTTFNSIFTGPNGVSMGAVGGQAQFPSSYSIFATSLRAGGAGVPGVAGSDLSGALHSQGVISSAISDLGQITLPSSGNSVSDSGKTWNSYVLTLGTGSFYGDSGVNPGSAMDSSGVIYEDLWKGTQNSSYAYQGYFTLDLSGGSANLMFTPSAAPVPEPTSIGLLSAGGFLWLLFARRLKRQLQSNI